MISVNGVSKNAGLIEFANESSINSNNKGGIFQLEKCPDKGAAIILKVLEEPRQVAEWKRRAEDKLRELGEVKNKAIALEEKVNVLEDQIKMMQESMKQNGKDKEQDLIKKLAKLEGNKRDIKRENEDQMKLLETHYSELVNEFEKSKNEMSEQQLKSKKKQEDSEKFKEEAKKVMEELKDKNNKLELKQREAKIANELLEKEKAGILEQAKQEIMKRNSNAEEMKKKFKELLEEKEKANQVLKNENSQLKDQAKKLEGELLKMKEFYQKQLSGKAEIDNQEVSRLQERCKLIEKAHIDQKSQTAKLQGDLENREIQLKTIMEKYSKLEKEIVHQKQKVGDIFNKAAELASPELLEQLTILL